MKLPITRTVKTQWLQSQQPNQPTKPWRRFFVIPRQLYTEVEKKVAVSGVDLWKVIRNERKVLLQKYPVVLWSIKQQAGEQSVLFCCIHAEHETRLPLGLNVLLPETWLLRYTLTPGVLYRVDSATHYWAYLHKNGKLHVTDIAGIMQQPRYFLDALGVQSIEQAAVPLQTSSFSELSIGHFLSVDLPGLLHYRSKTGATSDINWLRASAVFAGTLLLATSALSAGFIWYETKLSNQLVKLQSEVMSFTEQQDQLAAQQSKLERYETLFNRFPSVASGLSLLSIELDSAVDLMQAELSGRAIRMTGSADSATQVLEILNRRSEWQDARFERSVQRVQQREEFAITLTRREIQAQSPAESPEPPLVEDGSDNQEKS